VTLGNFLRHNRWHLAAAAFLLALTVFLGVRAADEDRWSDWGFGDAQTMLSLRQWEEGGWLDNYLLFIPQGYAAAIRHLDDPELRHHAHGTSPSSSPRVGPRLWYTHYPPGYLVPYALLFRLGIDGMPAARLLSVGFSIAALTLLFVFVCRLCAPPVAFLGALVYGLSPSYLGFADSLANQPLDDLLRFGFLLCIVYSTRADTPRARFRWAAAAWGAEFCLSLSSFDSVFFLYTWLIGWDLLEGRGFRWRRYLLFSLAPLSAHGLQFLQNAWYLGAGTAWVDILDTFVLKTAARQAEGPLATMWGSLLLVLQRLTGPPGLLGGLVLLYVGYRSLGRLDGDRETPSLGLLGVLFLCGLALVVILPHAARMPYQGRQMGPFAAVLVGGLLYSLVRTARDLLRPEGRGRVPWRDGVRMGFLLAGAPAMFIFFVFFAAMDRWAVYNIPLHDPDVRLAKELPTLPTAHEPIYFDIQGFRTFWDPAYMPGYPQIMPLLEYYAGSRPILCFSSAPGLITDLKTLATKAPARFSPVLVASDKDFLHSIVRSLIGAGILLKEPPGAYPVAGRFVVDLTEYMNWEGDASGSDS
jgi:hypothetical protein